MSTIAEILRPQDVSLDLKATTQAAAIEETAALLRKDARVLDWEALLAGLRKGAACLPATPEFGLCIPHTRTESLSSLVMSAGRSKLGIADPAGGPPVRYFFCIGVQVELAADYFRIVGLLARIVMEPASEQRLREAATGLEFVQALAQLEAKL
ncbi:MAG: fructose system component [Chthoniobacter sp.]|jgi:mannitol/fructose-specific phosphotransferase system IIA component (Ntr-type)|nr:fructose system component [Chthoniobacter sp.]